MVSSAGTINITMPMEDRKGKKSVRGSTGENVIKALDASLSTGAKDVVNSDMGSTYVAIASQTLKSPKNKMIKTEQVKNGCIASDPVH